MTNYHHNNLRVDPPHHAEKLPEEPTTSRGQTKKIKESNGRTTDTTTNQGILPSERL
jgi:hypothetical protein